MSSDNAISSHDIEPRLMWEMEYMLYHHSIDIKNRLTQSLEINLQISIILAAPHGTQGLIF